MSREWDRAYGQILREARHAIGLTQADVAKALGRVRSSVANIEAGRQPISAADAARLRVLTGAQPPEWPALDDEVAAVIVRQAAEIKRRAVIGEAVSALSKASTP